MSKTTITDADGLVHIPASQPLPGPRWLQPGRSVDRYTNAAGEGKVRAWLPCHEDQSVAVATWETSVNARDYLVRCRARSCARLYLLHLNDDGGGDWMATWIVHELDHLHHSSPAHGRQPF